MAEQAVQKQHPIPQQVLGVEFKLVGNLTLRQFGILAICGLLAYVFFISKIFIVLRLLLAAFFLIAGVGFAFVPVQDQPLDRWLAALFRAVYSPTKRVWQKKAEPPEFLVVPIPKLVRTVEEGVSPEEARRRLEEYLAAVKKKETFDPLELTEKQQLEFINLELQATTLEAGLPPPPPRRPSLPERRFEEAKKKPSLASTINYAAEPVFKLQRGEKVTYVTTLRNVRVGRRLSYAPTAEVVFAPAKEKVIEPTPPPTIEPVAPPPPPPLPPPPLPPAKARPAPPAPKEVKPPLPVPPGAERPTPAETLPALRPAAKPPSEIKKPLPPPKIEKPAPPKKLEKVELKPPPPPTGEPNSISGTIYDEKGRTVEGTLVAVKDQAGMTIRATKTNQLGQFSFSPLPNGYYSVELPKAILPFAIMKAELTGAVVPPLEIRAKR